MITVNINKAKLIAHELRRTARSEEFAPLDAAIARQIPGTDVQAVEAQRQGVRDKFAQAQAAIDAAQTPAELVVVLDGFEAKP